MDEITILKNSEILDNDINYFYQKILNEYPIMDFGIAIKEKKTEDTEKKEYDKEKLNKKLFTKCINISTDIDNYNFYLNNKINIDFKIVQKFGILSIIISIISKKLTIEII